MHRQTWHLKQLCRAYLIFTTLSGWQPCVYRRPSSHHSSRHLFHSLSPRTCWCWQSTDRHITNYQIHYGANKTLPTWWENVFMYYQVKKHVIYGLSVHFFFNGFIPAYLKTLLFAIYTLTEFSLLILNNQITGTENDLKRRRHDLSMIKNISETYHRRCFLKQPLL